MNNPALDRSILNRLIAVSRNPARIPGRIADRLSQGAPAQSTITWLLYRLAAWLETDRARVLLSRAAAEASLQHAQAAAVLYAQAIQTDPMRSEMYDFGARMAKAGSLGDQFFSTLRSIVKTKELSSMINHMVMAPEIYQPSQFWLYFMAYNALQIEAGGIGNFKQTVNKNYFNWTGDVEINEQVVALQGLCTMQDPRDNRDGGVEELLSESKETRYTRLLELLYRYTVANDQLGLLKRIQEPSLGNPMGMLIGNRKVTQDLCNTILDLNTIFRNTGLDLDATFTVYELGAGHGRFGYALLSVCPNARYVVIDIPPALYVSQWYLSNLFPDIKVMKFRADWSDAAFKDEFVNARVVFLSADQVAMLPDRSCDIFLNICSLQEMKKIQVDNWFSQIDRLCCRYFYTKQFYEHKNVLDGEVIRQVDYPVRPRWELTFSRTSPTFPSLYEQIYRLGPLNG